MVGPENKQIEELAIIAWALILLGQLLQVLLVYVVWPLSVCTFSLSEQVFTEYLLTGETDSLAPGCKLEAPAKL